VSIMSSTRTAVLHDIIRWCDFAEHESTQRKSTTKPHVSGDTVI
jgi:hypothetical protein